MCSKTPFLLLVFLLSFCYFTHAQTDDIGSGGAMVFDGVDDFINFGDIYSDLQLPFTISAWVKLDPSTVSGAPIFTNRNCDPVYTGFRLIVNNNLISLDYGDGLGGNNPAFRRGKNATISAIAGSWNHITAVVNGPNSIELYLNGINVGGTYGGNSSLPMDSGKPGFASTAYFISNGTVYRYKGTIDDMRLWNRALGSDEIQASMCIKLTGNESGLIGYWDFNETNGSAIKDRSSGHHNGYVVGNPVRVRSGAPIGDRSSNMYSASPITRSLTLLLNGQTALVKNLSSSVRGVQMYAVDGAPSDKTGLPGTISNAYFGVFVAQQQSTSTFSLELKTDNGTTCDLYTRMQNDDAPWKSVSTIVGQQKRIEVVQSADVPPFDLGPDLVICDGTSHEISTGLDDEQLQILWSTKETTPEIVATTSGWFKVTVKNLCSIRKDSIHLALSPTASAMNLGDDVQLCDQKQYAIATGLDDNIYDFKWNTGASTPSTVAQQSGWYVVTATGPCNQLKDSVNVQFLPTPEKFSLGDDVLSCEFEPVTLELPGDPAFQVMWENGSEDRKRVIKGFGKYWAVMSNACGMVSDTLTIGRYSTEMFIPNVITPNGDGLNDYFVLPHEPQMEVSLKVFNRWGQQVYFSPTYSNNWNGKGLPSGVYFFVVHGNCLPEKKGQLNILE